MAGKHVWANGVFFDRTFLARLARRGLGLTTAYRRPRPYGKLFGRFIRNFAVLVVHNGRSGVVETGVRYFRYYAGQLDVRGHN